MAFRTIDNALTALLSANANGHFNVQTSQRRSFDAKYISDAPIVTVFYDQGQFPKAAGGRISARHDMIFRIEVIAAAAAKMDLSVIDDPNATAQARQSAIAASTSAAKNADDVLDEALEYVYQIIRDPRNRALGLDDGFVSNPWIGAFEKSNPLPRGEYVILTGTWSFTCSATEVTVGATGVPIADIDTSIEVAASPSATQYDSADAGAEVT